MTRDDSDIDPDIARMRRKGLWVVSLICTVPIVLALIFIYATGFSERSPVDNMFYIAIALFLPLNLAFEEAAKWKIWEDLLPDWVSMTHRKSVALNLSVALPFAMVLSEDTDPYSTIFLNWLWGVPALFGFLMLVDIVKWRVFSKRKT